MKKMRLSEKFVQPSCPRTKDLLATVVCITLVIGSSIACAEELLGDRVAKKFIDNVVHITTTFSNGSTEQGFGLVIGERAGRVIAVTAEHVVRKNTPGINTEKIDVSFRSDKGRSYPAVLLNVSAGTKLDFTLIEITKPPGYRWANDFIDETHERGDDVWFIGRNLQWYIPTRPGKISEKALRSTNQVKAEQLSTARVGSSGAPLFTEEGIIGIIVTDDSGGIVAATDINVIKEAVTILWGYSWGERSETGAVPRPASQTGEKETTEKKAPQTRIANDLGMTFALIPAGTFMMGSPEIEPGHESDETLHEVTLTKDFYMQTTEVTQAQWRAVMGANPSSFKNCDDCPVENVSWEDRAYA